jgi:16S rRNA (guanine966-N2)-methyltransferase
VGRHGVTNPRPGAVRIIGGKWRRRKVPVLDKPGLRPTPDRVRETLFNWLQPVIPGSRCLDLFAGSGANGFEAASRGAREVVMVERDRDVALNLEKQAEVLQAQEVWVIWTDALAWLRGAPAPFDIVFLDPPFRHGLLAPSCELLQTGGWLSPNAYLYLEYEGAELPPLPEDWRIHRAGHVGQLHYWLAVASSGKIDGDEHHRHLSGHL